MLSHCSFGYSPAEGKVLSPRAGEVNGVSDTVRNTQNDPGMTVMMPHQHERDVALSFKIEAESSRVFYALSIPEYIEAWLQPPDTADTKFVFNLVGQETFRIDLYRAEALQSSVHCSCCVVGANQIRYIWKTTSPVNTTETLVDMHVLCASDGCVLGLKHSGFKDTVESAWCSRMWYQSLEKLCRLMRKH
jgi:uncharacterized protein YndB with AHSA1/START domain